VTHPAAVYRPRKLQLSDYYHSVEDYLETFIRIYDEYFSRQYGLSRMVSSYHLIDACHCVPERRTAAMGKKDRSIGWHTKDTCYRAEYQLTDKMNHYQRYQE